MGNFLNQPGTLDTMDKSNGRGLVMLLAQDELAMHNGDFVEASVSCAPQGEFLRCTAQPILGGNQLASYALASAVTALEPQSPTAYVSYQVLATGEVTARGEVSPSTGGAALVLPTFGKEIPTVG